MEQPGFKAEDVWGKLGITEHLGGVDATRRLLGLCNIQAGQFILDIGCGTGYTACLLAKDYKANVVAADINEQVLERARERVQEQGLSQQVCIIRSDIHALAFPAHTFDTVIAESVLVFCDKGQASAEVYRILKPGGVFAQNEFTFLKCPPDDWKQQLLSAANFGLNIQPMLKDEWCSVFQEAGFSVTSSDMSRLRLCEQFSSHIRVDGSRRYISAFVHGLAIPGVGTTFLNRNMLRAWRLYPQYVGYGLYLCRTAA